MRLQTLTVVCSDFVTSASYVLRPGSYPGCQRLFMRGFGQVFKSGPCQKPKTCRPVTDEAPRHTREKTSGTQGTCVPDA